jgi:hypothetical protein
VQTLATRLAAQGGAMLIVDYGHGRTAIGETLQAVRGPRPRSGFSPIPASTTSPPTSISTRWAARRGARARWSAVRGRRANG